MARIPIYDSQATNDSMGVAVDMALAFNSYKRSKPVRLSGLPQPLYFVSYEWQIDNNQPGSWEFLWYQEFWGDAVGWAGQPSIRLAPGFLPLGPWPREQIEVVQDATNTIYTSNLVRSITGNPTLNTPDARWVTLGSFAPFVRLAILLNTDPSLNPGVTVPRLRIWAHVVGYGSKVFESMLLPYGGDFGS